MEAMNGEHGEEYQEAMLHVPWTVTWDVEPRSQVPRAPNILLLTWVYRLKHYPDGCPRKFTA